MLRMLLHLSMQARLHHEVWELFPECLHFGHGLRHELLAAKARLHCHDQHLQAAHEVWHRAAGKMRGLSCHNSCDQFISSGRVQCSNLKGVFLAASAT